MHPAYRSDFSTVPVQEPLRSNGADLASMVLLGSEQMAPLLLRSLAHPP